VDTGIPQGGTVADELGAEALASYEDYFRQRVSDMWRRSLSAREGMRVRMEVRLSRSGDVLDVRVLDSSGDLAFDRSCEQAIHKAAPFEKLASVDPKTFNKHFRKRILEFSPEDLF
jgi:colicin import membrane protein